MKRLILILSILILCACNESGGSSATIVSAPQPDPTDPNITWHEINPSCVNVFEGKLYAKSDYTIFWVRIYDSLSDCQTNTFPKYLKLPGDCQTRSSADYGAHIFCYTTKTDELSNPNNIWITNEFLGYL